MIFDAHVHAWERWPWPAQNDGRAERLLAEMDRVGIAQAVVVCASLNGNDANTEYVAAASLAAPGRLIAFADIDSRWSRHHRQHGIGERVDAAVERWGVKGISHYLDEDDDGEWLAGSLGVALADGLDRHGLVLSIAALPRHMLALGAFARHRPNVPIVLHHMGGISADRSDFAGQVQSIAAMAIHPNVILKISGFPHVAPSAALPFEEVRWLAKVFANAFGPARLAWGSDYPVVERAMAYEDALEVSRRHYDFLSAQDQTLLFGGTIRRLLAGASEAL